MKIAETLLTKLEEIIKREPYLRQGNVLIEEEKQALCKEVTLNTTGKKLIYKFDIHGTFPFFSSGEQHSLSDYLVFYPFENQLFVFICNLKSSNLGNTQAQALAGSIFAKFLLETAFRCSNLPFNPKHIQIRCLHFSAAAKKISTNPRDVKYTTHQINGLYFRHLPCDIECNLDANCKIKISANQ